MSAEPPAFLADLTTCEVAERAAAGAVLAVPLGSTEQHGPHLPLSTDTDVAVELCRGWPPHGRTYWSPRPCPTAAAASTAGFAGTLSIGAAALEQVVVELGRSATDTFARRGARLGARRQRRRRCAGRSPCCGPSPATSTLFEPRYAGDAHAGRSETSMLLALRPARRP